VNATAVFDLEEPSLDSFMALPQWLQKKVQENLEFEGSLLKRLLDEGEKGVPAAESSEEEESNEAPY